jgi:hypothetical protein
MRSTRRIIGSLIAASTLTVGAVASAQDCTVSTADPACYHLKGSDTLFDIMTTAINAARTAGVPGAKNLYYEGTGSGNAETAMSNKGPAVGSLGSQSIGPMSRNFRPKWIDALAVGSAGNVKTSWYPGVANVVALDAAVFVVKSTTSCKNVSFPTIVDSATGTGVTRARTNTTTLPTLFGNGTAFNNLASTANYDNLLMVALGGVDGSGSLQACSDPRRVQALQDLAGCMGVDHIEHIYRRDDNSGTTDTWKDRIIVTASTADPRYPWVGGRFCNGQSIGGINGANPQYGICSVTRSITTCANDAGCPTGEVCQFNLNNQDLDPIRRSCVAPDATHAPTSCTDTTTGLACQASDNNPNCTQGLIVALTDTDPPYSALQDITTSIAARVKNDSTGTTTGYAGRTAVAPGLGTKGLAINTTGFTDTNVRKDAYLLSRRLFLQNALAAGQPAAEAPTDTATAIGITGAGAPQLTAEQNLFNFMTDVNGSASNPVGTPGRCNVDPIVKQFNFITCTTDCNTDVSTLSGNLCANTPAPAVAGALGALLPNGPKSGTVPVVVNGFTFNYGVGGAKFINSTGSNAACTAGSVCVSGPCTAALTCPAANGRPSNAACSQGSDCASGQCIDALGLAAAPASLLCL